MQLANIFWSCALVIWQDCASHLISEKNPALDIYILPEKYKMVNTILILFFLWKNLLSVLFASLILKIN